MSAPASPCRNLCGIDELSGECAGCSRTLEEIAAWSGMSASEKARVLARIDSKQKKESSEMTKENNTQTAQEVYLCIGICTTDPESGQCIGCGRPPEGSVATDEDKETA